MAKTKMSGLDRFERASTEIKPRLIWCSYGEFGTGKTTFALGAPGPIVVQSFDQGLEGVVEEIAKTKDIYAPEYLWRDGKIEQEEAIELRDRFIEDYEHAVQHARTVIWDKETQIWKMFRFAEFGSASDAPSNYDELNERYRYLLAVPKALDLNFGVIQDMKDKWETKSKVDRRTGQSKDVGSSTGDRIRAGFKEVGGSVHINIQHRRENGVFYLDVGKARGPGGSGLQDQSFENLSFSDFAQLVFPETEEEDWQ